MYTIIFSTKLKTKKIPKAEYLRIRERVSQLAQDPRPRWAEKLKAKEGFRISVGDYRILYSIDEDMKRVIVIDIGNRKDVYRKQ